jgi:23S rRNA pseudouridine2604 synthase
VKRLNKFISETGTCSRREADGLIESGRVTVNGVRAGLGTQVGDGDVVTVDGVAIGERDRPRPVYIALNKPVGITCTTERHVEGNIVDFVDHEERIFPIGRLDKDSEGLILMTNDGDIVNEVLRAEHNHEKEYVVALDRSPTDDFFEKMAAGVRIPDGMTKRCKVWRIEGRVFRIVLTQGLNRQIRKMCEALGYEVIGLQRVRIMHIELGTLKPGKWRNLSDGEVKGLLPPPSEKPRPEPKAHPQPARQQPTKPRPKPQAIPFGSRPEDFAADGRSGGRPGGGRPGGRPGGGRPGGHGKPARPGRAPQGRRR